MGAACSSDEDKNQRQAHAEIEKNLNEERKFRRREVKILLLGAGESGKSTIFKQMKILFINGFNEEEKVSFKSSIYGNVVSSLQAICDAMEKLGIEFENSSNQEVAAEILEIPFTAKIETKVFCDTVVPAVKKLLPDKGIQECIFQSSKYYLLDSAQYFFDAIDRLNQPDYVPSVDDVLHVRVKTTGIAEIRFTIGQLRVHMFDVGGQRSERKKWIHCFENVTSLIFCVGLAAYNQQLVEDTKQNRMLESLLLFESVVNSKWFTKTSIILFLNMTDLFQEKIKVHPLKDYFPEYEGGEDFDAGSEFILEKFAELNRAGLQIYPHLTCATDTTNIKFVFAAVKETILQNSLKDAGLL